jgi:hypothetical protein
MQLPLEDWAERHLLAVRLGARPEVPLARSTELRASAPDHDSWKDPVRGASDVASPGPHET